ncbi:hypothetical protein RFI_32331, partial [Reticulomyxa filosa]
PTGGAESPRNSTTYLHPSGMLPVGDTKKNIKTSMHIISSWSSPEIKKQKIETWNLRSDKWDKYLERNWKNGEIMHYDFVVESWTNCVVESAKQSIGTRIIWKGNKPWWSDSLHRKRKQVHRMKKEYRKNRTETNYKKYKRAAMQLKKKLRHEKQEYLIKSIQSLKGENTRQYVPRLWKRANIVPIPKPDRDHSQELQADFIIIWSWKAIGKNHYNE